jgi:hypothetical protein
VSDPVFGGPREVELTEPVRPGPLRLLRRGDFRTLFVAVSVSELGDALNYIALCGSRSSGAARSASWPSVSPTACRGSSSGFTAGSPPTAGAGAG